MLTYSYLAFFKLSVVPYSSRDNTNVVQIIIIYVYIYFSLGTNAIKTYTCPVQM